LAIAPTAQKRGIKKFAFPKTEFEFVRPYDLIPKYRAFCEARPAEGGASKQQNAPEFSKCLNWLQLLNEARTFFERNSD